MTTPHMNETIALVGKLFDGKTDKGGQPYATHCYCVAGIAAQSPHVLDDEIHAALLHDAVEDGRITIEQLRKKGYSERTVNLVDCLTRREYEPYEAYIASIGVSRDLALIQIKLADLADNLDPARALPEECETLRRRYELAQERLNLAVERTQSDRRDFAGRFANKTVDILTRAMREIEALR